MSFRVLPSVDVFCPPFLFLLFGSRKSTQSGSRYLDIIQWKYWGVNESSLFVCLFQGFLAVVCLSPDRHVSICRVPKRSWHSFHELSCGDLLRGAVPLIQYYTGMNQAYSRTLFLIQIVLVINKRTWFFSYDTPWLLLKGQ